MEIRIFINGVWETLDPPEKNIAINYQSNTLASLETRESDYSQNLDLPLTPRNTRALGVYLSIDSLSDVPYQNFPARVFSEGVEITRGASSLQVLEVKSNSISCQIKGGEVPIFDVLKTKSMNSGESTDFAIFWEGSQINSQEQYLAGGEVSYFWAYANLVENPLSPDDVGAPPQYINSPSLVYPGVHFFELIEWILQQEGISLNLKVTAEEMSLINEFYVLCTSPTPLEKSTSLYFNAVASPSGVSAMDWDIPDPPRLQGYFGFVTPDNLLFYAPWDGTVTLRMSYVLSDTAVRLTVSKNSRQVINSETLESGVKDFEIEVTRGDLLSTRVIMVNPSGSATVSATFKTVTPSSTRGAVPGVVYDALSSLGFDNRGDLVLEFLRMFGLTPKISDSTLTLYSWGYILRNKAKISGGWSDKLVEVESISFQDSGFAQNSKIELKPSPPVSTEYTFVLTNKGLSASKTLWTSKFLALADSANAGDPPAANVPLFSVTREGDRKKWTLESPPKSINPCICKLSDSPERGVSLYQGGTLTQENFSTRVLSWESLSPEDISAGVKPLFNEVLSSMKLVSIRARLTPVDIQLLPPEGVVWITPLGHYFYIRKIVNFTPGVLTTVNLIRI